MDRVTEVSYLIAITGRARRQARPIAIISLSYRGREAGFVLSHFCRELVPILAEGPDGSTTGKPVRLARAANVKRATA
jgi:hypothetical protein